MDEFLPQDGSDGGDASASSLAQSIIGAVSGAYQTTVVANANPLNAALITGGAATTQAGSASGTTGLMASASSTTWIIIALAVVIGLFAFANRK